MDYKRKQISAPKSISSIESLNMRASIRDSTMSGNIREHSSVMANATFLSPAPISLCGSTALTSYSEDQESSDCSSIVSSISFKSMDYFGGGQSIVPTDGSILEGEGIVSVTSSFEFEFPARHVSIRLSCSASFTSIDHRHIFDSTELGDHTINDQKNPPLSVLPFIESNSRIDFFLALPQDLVSHFLSFLDVKSLCTCFRVSRQALMMSSSDDAGWKVHCQNDWSQKSFVLDEARQLYRTGKAMNAYKLAVNDARNRQQIRPEELCYNLTSGEGVVWEFRFKEAAGLYWTSFDPWWRGGQARTIVFLTDGSIKQIIQSRDSKKFAIYPPFSHIPHEGEVDLEFPPDPAISQCGLTWRFVEQPMDLPQRARGAYIRISVDGRDVPTYVVRRSPTGDWGFVIENCWAVYSSSPLAKLGVLSWQPEAPVRRARIRLRRTLRGARWLNVDGIESDSDDEERGLPIRPNVDSTYSVSPRSQWKEAWLYNYGTTVLPEGEHATAEFDRVWKQALLTSEQEIAQLIFI